MLETKWEMLPRTAVVPMGAVCGEKQSDSRRMLGGAMGSADHSDAGCRERKASRLPAELSLTTMGAVWGQESCLDTVKMPVDICVS